MARCALTTLGSLKNNIRLRNKVDKFRVDTLIAVHLSPLVLTVQRFMRAQYNYRCLAKGTVKAHIPCFTLVTDLMSMNSKEGRKKGPQYAREREGSLTHSQCKCRVVNLSRLVVVRH